jgi:hypothetical protein
MGISKYMRLVSTSKSFIYSDKFVYTFNLLGNLCKNEKKIKFQPGSYSSDHKLRCFCLNRGHPLLFPAHERVHSQVNWRQQCQCVSLREYVLQWVGTRK